MKTRFVFVAFCLSVGVCFGQTFQTSGSWTTGTNWSTGSTPSGAGTDITVSADPTISTTEVIGSITDGNAVAYTILGTGNLSVGASGTPKNMTFNNSGSIAISSGGVLEIWGDLNVNNNLALTVVGSLIVHGNINMNNNATVTVTGGGVVTVAGNLTGQQNTHLSVSGSGSTIAVTGALSLGSGTSSIATALGGKISAASCSCTGCSLGFDCSVVPITLLFFKGTALKEEAVLNWATSSEINFDYFLLERSSTGTQFAELARVQGSGNSNTRKDYSFTDRDPFIGNSFYRITSVDFDGYTQVFNNNVVRVNVAAEKQFHVYPNPIVNSKLIGKVNCKLERPAQVQVFNNLGILLGTFETDLPQFEFSLPSLSGSNVLLVRFSTADFSTWARVMVSQ